MILIKNRLRIITSVLIAFIFNQSIVYSKPVPVAKKAILDLRNWDFNKDGNVKLDGEWAFYWGKKIDPHNLKQFSNPDLYINVPDKWENYSINGKSLPINGYATYHLQILIRKTNDTFKLHIPWPLLPTVCYVNGEKIGYNGVVGESVNKTIHEYKFHYNDFRVSGDTIDILIQTANSEYEKGGLCFNITIGKSEVLEQKIRIQDVMEVFFLGCLFLMTIYHFILYLLRKKDKSPLYLAITCLGAGLLYAFISNDFIHFLDTGFRYSTILYILLIPSCLMYAGIFLFIYYLFPKDFTRTGIIIVLTICLFNFLLYPINYSLAMYLEQYFKTLRILAFVYGLVVIVIAVFKKREDAFLFLIGLSFVIIGAIIDLLIQLNSLNIPSPLQFCILGLFLMQAVIIARRFSRAFHNNEMLTTELIYMNENLENMVVKRTETIEQQNKTLMEINKTKDRLFAIIGHDLRSPLAALHGVSNVIAILLQQQKFERLQKVTEQIDISVQQMTGLLDNLLKWSFVQSNQMSFNPQKIDLFDIAQTTISLLQPLASLKQIAIISHIQARTELYADENLMKTVLRNILSNAIKFTNRNGTIELNAIHQGNNLIISIKDNGVGIDQEKIEKLFEIDEHKISAGTNKEKGTGLGLVLCKEFIQKHQGTISVETEKMRGTTFFIKLPISK